MTLPPDIADRLGRISVGLRQDLTVTRHEMRRKITYVFHDPTTFRNHAFDVDEYRVMNSIGPDRTLDEVFARLMEQGVLEEHDRGEFFGFVLALHELGLLQLPLNDAGTHYERYRLKRRARLRSLLMAPMYLKVPMWDPDRFLDRTFRTVKPLFSRWGLLACAFLWLVVAWKLLGHFGELFGEAGALLNPANVPMLYLVIVGLKVLHEFGHGYMCKKYGGEVPEMGVAFIVCTPCAYVDASASWKFESRWHRIAVGVAGMYVESIIAAVFALVWLGTHPGSLHDLALNVCILSTVTTVLFNLNPLMKFDGYYVFADLMGTANLRERSSRFIKTWASQRLLGLECDTAEHAGERWLLAGYGTASTLYKMSLAFGITAMMLLHWPMVGLVLGVFFGWALLVTPALKCLRWLWSSEATLPVRGRARVIAVALVSVFPLLITQIPLSRSVVSEGILEPGYRHVLRAPVSGFVTEVRADNGEFLWPGQTVVRLVNDELELETRIAAEELRAEEAQRTAYVTTDPARAAYHAAGARYLAEYLATLRQRGAELDVQAPFGGMLIDDDPRSLAGRFVTLGEPLVEVHGGALRLHALIPAAEVERAQIAPGCTAEVVWTAAPDIQTTAEVVEVRPVASKDDIPTPLSMTSGGRIYTVMNPAGTESAPTPYVHVYLEPQWVPEHGRANLTVRVRFASEVRTVGNWLRTQLLDLYNAWRLS